MMSRSTMATTRARPRPGTPKACSTATEPPSTKPSSTPEMVMTGSSALGRGWRRATQPPRRALAPRRPHEVLADDFQQARAGHARDVGALGEPQHEGGTDHHLEVLPGVLPEVDDDEGRLVAEPEERGEHDEHAQPEARDGDEEDGHRPRDAVGNAVGLERAEDAHREADQPG